MLRRGALTTIRAGTGSLTDYTRFCQVAVAAGLDFPVDPEQLRARDAACLEQGAVADYWFVVDARGHALAAAVAFELIRYPAPGRRFIGLGVDDAMLSSPLRQAR